MTASLPKAALGAFGLELLLLVLAFLWITHQNPRPPAPLDTIQMTLVPPAPVVKLTRPVAKTPTPRPPRPRPVPRPVIHQAPPIPVRKVLPHPVIKPLPKPAPKPVTHKVVRRLPVTQPVVRHTVQHAPVKTVVKQAVKTLPANPVVVPASYRDIVRAAVQRAVVYPLAARIAQITGKARVSFIYSHGRVSDERILVSSGASVLDQAALSAVRNAVIPEAPPHLRGETLHFEIWVRFYMEHS